MSAPQHEWDAFRALVSYFFGYSAPLRMRERLRRALETYPEPSITKDALLLRAGLSFFANELDPDLALMQLVREGVLQPVPDRPFTFNIRRSKGITQCVPSESKPAARCG